MCSATTPAVRPGWFVTATPISDAVARSMLSVPMEQTDMRRSLGSEHSTSARQVTAPRVLIITSASLARSTFCSSVGAVWVYDHLSERRQTIEVGGALDL